MVHIHWGLANGYQHIAFSFKWKNVCFLVPLEESNELIRRLERKPEGMWVKVTISSETEQTASVDHCRLVAGTLQPRLLTSLSPPQCVGGQSTCSLQPLMRGKLSTWLH